MSKSLDSVTSPDRGRPHQALLSKYCKDHETLHRLFNEVQAALAGPAAANNSPRLLIALAKAVGAHFRLEEVGGIFDQIELDAPHLSREVRQLRADHRELMEEANELADASVRPWDESSAHQLANLLQRFRDRMQRHESEENCLVQRAYSDDVGTKD